MKKAIFDHTGNHQLIETGHKTFDEQCDGIMTGNVWGDVQFSGYIRSWTDPGDELYQSWNKGPAKPGEFTRFDLNGFKSLPHRVHDFVVKYAKSHDESCILYEFRHHDRGRKHVHGYIITDDHQHHIQTFVTGSQYFKSYSVLDAVRSYICEEA
jgi:hypothetical protein